MACAYKKDDKCHCKARQEDYFRGRIPFTVRKSGLQLNNEFCNKKDCEYYERISDDAINSTFRSGRVSMPLRMQSTRDFKGRVDEVSFEFGDAA